MTLALFIIGVTLLTLYGLTVSGHFPFELRTKELQTLIGGFVIGATLVTSGLTAIIMIVVAFGVLPWPAILLVAAARCLRVLWCYAFCLMTSLTGLLVF